MNEKVYIITGGTSGVGYSLVRDIGRNGSRIFFVGHNRLRGAAIEKSLQKETENSRIQFIAADLGDPAEVRRLAEEISHRTDRIDVLSYNAGTFSLDRKATKAGLERTFSVNYLGFYGLSLLLLPLLTESAPSRIISVSGGPRVLARASINLADLQMESGYNGVLAAIRAALAKVLCTLELSRALSGTGVTANTYHPGLVKSGLGNHLPTFLRPLFAMANVFLSRSTKTGIFAATAEETKNLTGCFFASSRIASFHHRKHTQADIDALINKSGELTGIPWGLGPN